MTTALVIGAGPAGLMAADVLGSAGVQVTLADQMPSPARKFLMAGKSGLNLTRAEDAERFLAAYGLVSQAFAEAVAAFGPEAVQHWAEGLGQAVFTGSTGRVFPRVMKASPLLRAWLARLDELGVVLRRHWRWEGFAGAGSVFATPEGQAEVAADITVLAMGGASWRRLGSDGEWAGRFGGQVAPFAASNVGLRRAWSRYMEPHFGAPLKAVALKAAGQVSRGEVVLTRDGIEGGGIYALTPQLRAGAALSLDLVPDRSAEDVAEKRAARAKVPVAHFLRSTLRLPAVKISLFQEIAKSEGLPDPLGRIKELPLAHEGLQPMDGAISTAGGLRFGALDGWMLRARPGVFAAGEMLDWEAPTGGYLITGCLASGRAAALQALDWAARG